MINQLPPEMIDTFTIYLIIGVVLIVLGIAAGYIQGRTVARMASDEFWNVHDEHLAELQGIRHDRAVEGGYKSHETRKRREISVGRILTGTECDL